MQLTYGWDFLGQVDLLDDGNPALFDGALEIDVLDLLAEIRLGIDQTDVSIFDLEIHICALLDLVLHRASCCDVKCCAPIQLSVFLFASQSWNW